MKLPVFVITLLAVNPLMADDSKTWMCLFENVPTKVISPSSLINDKKMRLEITNNMDFPLSKVAVDLSIYSEGGQFEDNIVFPFPAHLQPGEVREVTAYLTMSEELAKQFYRSDLEARAAVANVLDQEERRMVQRENLGPSFQVFWPFQPKSEQPCEMK